VRADWVRGLDSARGRPRQDSAGDQEQRGQRNEQVRYRGALDWRTRQRRMGTADERFQADDSATVDDGFDILVEDCGRRARNVAVPAVGLAVPMLEVAREIWRRALAASRRGFLRRRRRCSMRIRGRRWTRDAVWCRLVQGRNC